MSMLTSLAVAERALLRSKPSDEQPSQRELVALSLLLYPRTNG